VVGGVVALALVAGCASPGGEAPRSEVAEAPAEPDTAQLIRFRTLSRGDFRSSQPPPGFEAYRERLGAATCAQIAPNPGTHARIERDAGGGFVAVPEGLGYSARMDRACSWWNTSSRQFPPEYVLEHEQIHFALVELEARRMNARLPEIVGSARSRGATPEEAARGVETRLREVLEASLRAAAEQSNRFDQETSLGLHADRQREWRLRVEAELERTRADAEPGLVEERVR
jgi:hypothetical protein